MQTTIPGLSIQYDQINMAKLTNFYKSERWERLKTFQVQHSRELSRKAINHLKLGDIVIAGLADKHGNCLNR